MEWTPLGKSSEIGKKYERDCNRAPKDGYFRLGKIGSAFPNDYMRHYERIRDFQIYPDDICVVSMPKAGTTLVQEMVYCIVTNLDFNKAREVPLHHRFPYLEYCANFSPDSVKKLSDAAVNSDASSTMRKDLALFTSSFDVVEALSRPRFIKSHLPYSLLPNQLRSEESTTKLIYVSRNPKDTCVSFYHNARLMIGYKGTLDDMAEAYLADCALATPYWSHVKEFWEIKDQPTVLFLKFEDMKKDLPSVIQTTADFLGKSLNTGEVSVLANHLSFEKMKANPSVNYEELVQNLSAMDGSFLGGRFMRKGGVNSWKDEMSSNTIAKFDAWIEKNKICGLYD